ncbi:MAG: SCO1664 family protein [Nitriliruptor sp.]|uniref:SCO1664 family protein n=1 Tax=Nitriliruptor sp. TaxID=2448056 RepID=UPI00349FF32F
MRTATFEVIGRFADASNATLLVRLTDRDARTLAELAEELGRDPELDDLDPSDLAVHKPRRGESPLWDFPTGTLHLREAAAYEVSAALGWDLVPVTVVIDAGPFGAGSLQRYVPHDPAHHYFHLLERGDEAVLEQLRAMVVLDAVIDNADRKGGHVLLERSTERGGRLGGQVRLVDHGVSFNVDHKLRTVGWHFAGEPVPHWLRTDVATLADELSDGALRDRLGRLLTGAELAVLAERVGVVAAREVFPEPGGRHPFPWPML